MKKWRSVLFLSVLLLLLMMLPALAQAATVSGTVFNDKKSQDGLMEKEKGLGNVTLVLEGKDGSTQEATSGRDGSYFFEGVAAGDYRITSSLPSGYVASFYGANNAFLPAQGSDVRTNWFFVGDTATINLGVTKSDVYISLIAFEDSNVNGGRMLSEPLLRGVEVELISVIGEENLVVASGVTDKEGSLVIRSLSPGAYYVFVTLPDEQLIIGPKGTKINGFYNCINPSEGHHGSSDLIELKKGSVGMGIGAVKTGSARGLIWYDANANGLKDADETGFTGAQVTLTSAELQLVRTAVVAEDGSYQFDQLQPATYTLAVLLPGGYMFTLPGGDSYFTDGYTDTQATDVIVTAESSSNIPTVGVMDVTSVMVSFYQDQDANGIKDPADKPFQGAVISVIAEGREVASAMSDINGEALIPMLRGGEVKVRATLPEGVVFSNASEGNQFSTIGAKNEWTVDVSLSHGALTVLNAGVTSPAGVSGMLFSDNDNDGLMEQGESGLPGFTVQAVDRNGNIVAETVTGDDGSYLLSPLLPDAHTLRFLLPDPYIASPYIAGSDAANAIISQNANYGDTDVYGLYPAQMLSNIYAGVFKAGTVAGYVYQNKNHDSLATKEGGMPGVLVTLLKEAGSEYSSYTNSVTDENGLFYIKGLLPGTYSVRYELNGQMLFTDTDETIKVSASFTSGMGTETVLEPLGAVYAASISGAALHGDMPIGAQITLTGAAFGMSKSVIAGADGSYALSLLRPDTYSVTVELPEGYVFAQDTCALVPLLATNISSSSITLGVGELSDGLVIKAALPAVLSGTLYFDQNNSGAFDEGDTLFSGVSFDILSADKAVVETLTTDENGQYTSGHLIPGSYIISMTLENQIMVNQGAADDGGRWTLPFSVGDGEYQDTFDIGVLTFGSISGSLWSMDGATNNLSGLTVNLLLESNLDKPVMTAVTDQNGDFIFTGLYPDRYVISVVLPDNHMFARSLDTTSSTSVILADTEEGKLMRSAAFGLTMGDQITDCDIGFGAVGAIGDFAWLDENGNGMQDIGERGVPGIRIEMLQYGSVAAEAVTNLYGHYYLDGLYPGEYQMRVTMPDEVKSTKQQNEFPLVNSVLPESDETTVTADGILVPSGSRDLSVDLGFALRKEGVYPPSMEETPTTDWSYGGTKNK